MTETPVAEETEEQAELREQAGRVNQMTQNARAVLNFLEEHPDMPKPDTINVTESKPTFGWMMFSYSGSLEKQKKLAQRVVRFMGGKVQKDSGYHFVASGERDGIVWRVTIEREAICERKVVGTKTVEEFVTDPDAKKVMITREVDQVEWDCGNLLGDD